jgi:hypothetical protein
MAELAHIVEAITFDCPFDAYVHVRGIVDFLDRPRIIDIHCGTIMAAAILRSFPGATVRSIMVEDTDHDVLALRIGCPIEDMRDTTETLVYCETLTRKPKPEESDMSQTLGDLLRQKFGDI